MTDTILSSATKEVVIGFDRPLRRHRRTHQPDGPQTARGGNEERRLQPRRSRCPGAGAAGAQVLDVNAGIPLADEPAILAESIKLIQSITDVPLCIDSSIVDALEAGLAVYEGKPLVNSVTGEEERLEVVLPLVKKYECAVVAISE